MADITRVNVGRGVVEGIEISHALALLLTVAGTLRPPRSKGQARRAAISQIIASAKEISMFQLAMDKFSNSQGTSSQRTSGAFMIWSKSSSVETSAAEEEVQVDGPCHQPRSTPV